MEANETAPPGVLMTLGVLCGMGRGRSRYVQDAEGCGEGAEPSHEAIVAITAGTIASSTALIGWQFSAREFGSASAVADSKQTLLCTYLSAVLLVGPVKGCCAPSAATVPAAAKVSDACACCT